MTSVFALTGRALPLLPWLIYIGYVVTVVLCFYYRVPNFKDVPELKGLTFPVSALGGSGLEQHAAPSCLPSPRPASSVLGAHGPKAASRQASLQRALSRRPVP